jgi:glucose-6-phosphate 1-epimerase
MNPLERHEIPGAVTALAGKGGLPAVQVDSARSTAVIYQHGAHVASWVKKDGPPVLFLSGSSDFLPDKPIRGGVPVIFPWFGAREGHPFHATARLADWDLSESLLLDGGDVRLRFLLPGDDDLRVSFVVTVGESLRMELTVINRGTADFTFENCLHTYFTVGDIHRTEVRGLQGVSYLDKLLDRVLTEEQQAIRFTAETDRIYQNTEATTEIADAALGRLIRIRKSGSLSTVVWNPWIDKARNMPDFGDEEYLGMVCVESGNVREHAITLAPGASHTLAVEIDTRELV